MSLLDRFSEILVDLFEKRKFWLFSGFSILYLALTCLLASYKMMWNDELYSFYISRLSSISEVWSTLMTGAEQTPPLFYLITRASFALFGVNELSIRLPEIIGFWIMIVCLFWFVSRRTSAVYGFVAMLFPLVTGAYFYAYEARPYGLILGLSSLALACWQSATERDDRKVRLAGLALSLAAAVSCHYYAAFVFIALALGEAVRSISLRRIDIPTWLMLGFGATPLVGFLPLIRQASSYSATFWAKPRWMDIPEFYFSLLAPAVLPLITILILSAIYPATDKSGPQYDKNPLEPRLHEVAAAFGFVSIPLIAVTLSVLITGAFTGRYALPAVIGISILVAFGAHRLLYQRPAIAATLVICLCGSFLGLWGKFFTDIVATRQVHTQTIEFLRAEGKSDFPIVVTDQHAFISLAHYAPRDLASRLIYLSDPDRALHYLGHNSVEKGTLDMLKPWFRLPIVEYGPYIKSQKHFFVYGSAGHFLNWLLSELSMSHKHIELRGRNKDSLLFLVGGPEDALQGHTR